MSPECNHERLVVVSNAESKFERLPVQRLRAAKTLSGRLSKESAASSITIDDSYTFPAPPVLPGDELDQDPKHPPQSFRSWIHLKERNHVTNRSNTIYVAAPPVIGNDVEFLQGWSWPSSATQEVVANHPCAQKLLEYLQAFYHGMNVKLVRSSFQYTAWDTIPRKGKGANRKGPSIDAITLETNTSGTRIRTRPCPDAAFDGQLNLNDLLDACIDTLPDDAYALLLMVDHDLYEDEDDDFCCGRAYGGSRVAVVSTARYHPALDDDQDLEHAWPASHCVSFVENLCGPVFGSKDKKKKGGKAKDGMTGPNGNEGEIGSPLRAAVDSHSSLPSLITSRSFEVLSGLWLGRACRTASHELGHCLGIAHCIYYACVMQGTASIEEDARQPPYLCPVDMAKVLTATGSSEIEWCEAMLGFCEGQSQVHLFAAFASWLRARLVRLKRGEL